MTTSTPVREYTPRIWLNDMQVHLYRIDDLTINDEVTPIPRCQEGVLHPTPHERIRLHDKPVRRSGSLAYVGARMVRCTDCYSADACTPMESLSFQPGVS